ncbi:hypothetical protein B0A55_10046 [Friedmanniomyces simplex]|uniref:Uncharacterized protein n=1 Tax=Friedmanniomyces simplex TaxID=329884 RepID=A0A4U0XP21_9PEZI|nr:hypothetical protein B0A55_10046 [Friedmanniomyces simplex]
MAVAPTAVLNLEYLDRVQAVRMKGRQDRFVANGMVYRSARTEEIVRYNMSDDPLNEERYAPDQASGPRLRARTMLIGTGSRVLVTCIFLKKIKAVQAEHLLGAFLEEYSTPERLRSADLKDI